MSRRRVMWFAATAFAVPAALAPAAAAAAPAANSLTIHGRGNGHGVGLPQDGARSLGRAGKSAAQILSTFYPGTTLTTDRTARMHVEVWHGDPTTSTQISLPGGGRIYGPAGHIAVPAGGVVTLAPSGSNWHARLASLPAGTGGRGIPRRLADDPSPASPDPQLSGSPDTPAPDPSGSDTSTPTPAVVAASSPPADVSTQPGAGQVAATPTASGGQPPSPEPTRPADATRRPTENASPSKSASPGGSAVPSSPAARLTLTGSDLDIVPTGADGVTTILSSGRSYRGQILTAPGELVNDVPLELYLRGLGEVRDPSWPQAGLQALVIAARTYALRDALGAADPGDHQQVNICATDDCQVYLGANVEYPQLTQAVEATEGKVVEYQGALAGTYYSASAGGETATPTEGFGAGSTDVPYLTPVSYDDGGHDGWQRSIDLGAAASALHYPGRLSGIEVTARGPSGRAMTVALHGTAGDVAATGVSLESALGLPSTLFTTGLGVDAPQVAQAASSTTLPALTAASLGQVSVPAPVLADPVVFSQAASGEAPVTASSVNLPMAIDADLPAQTSAARRGNPRGRTWGLFGGLALVSGLSAAALRQFGRRVARPSRSARHAA